MAQTVDLVKNLLPVPLSKENMPPIPETESMIKSWETRRLAHVDANRSKIIVGHDDVAALPTEKT